MCRPARRSGRTPGSTAWPRPRGRDTDWRGGHASATRFRSEARPELERQIEQIDEQEDGECRHDDACNRRLDPPRFRRAGTRHDKRHERGDDQSKGPHRGGENEDRYGDPEWPAHGIAFERLALAEKAHGGDDAAESDANTGEQPPCRAGPERKAAQA